MNYLFLHQNFPAQYQHLVRHLAADKDNRVVFITQPNRNQMAGVEKVVYRIDVQGAGKCHALTLEIDNCVRTGAAAADACLRLREEGFRPDIAIGHCGWGETLFVKDIFPDVPVLANFEFYYHQEGADVGFDPEFHSIFADPQRLRMKNAINHMAFAAADWGHAATRWQRGLYPEDMRQRITAIHEGVDTDVVKPDLSASISLARDDLVLRSGDEIVTYVARNLEPYRGFHIFMRALPKLFALRPHAHALIVGGNGVSYGAPPPPGQSWRDVMLKEVGTELDLSRVHFLGQIPYEVYVNLLQVSAAHVYLTYPFVLSWSFVEAMAAGCMIVASNTAPVLELLKDGANGLTIDFFSADALAETLAKVLAKPARFASVRRHARQLAVDRFDFRRRQLTRWNRLITCVRQGKPAPLDQM